MNWEWDDDNYDRWYHIGAGSWHIEGVDADGNPVERNYDYERAMITVFESIN